MPGRWLSRVLVVGLALAAAVPLPAAAQQQPKAGVVTTLQGEATVARPIVPQPLPLRFKDDVFMRDLITTRARSVVRILLGGKAVVTVRELSSLVITEEPGRATIDMREGRLAIGVAKELMRQGESIDIRTPNAVAAIRGSALVAEVTAAGGAPQTAFTALEATLPITVAPLNNPTLAVTLAVNQAVTVSGIGASAVMSPVRTLTPAQARAAARTAEAPKSKEHSEKAPEKATAQIGNAGVQEAAQLASTVAPASATDVATSALSSRPSTSTSAIGVNEQTAAQAAVVVPSDTPVITLTGHVDLGPNDFVFPASETRRGPAPYAVVTDAEVTSVQQPFRATHGINVSLGGPLVSTTRSDIHTGDPTANVFGFLFVADGSRIGSTSPAPFLQFDAATVDSAGNLVSVRRSPSVASPTTLQLAGPLFAATGSSFNTTSLGFDATFGTAGGTACCSGFSFSQGAQLVSSSPLPFVSLVNSTFSSGPDAQTGSNLIFIGDTFTGAPAAELVAPASVSLAGPLLSAAASNLSALSRIVLVSDASLSSSSPDPLVSLSGGSVTSDSHLLEARLSAHVSLAGPFLSVVGTSINARGNLVRIADGASLSSTTTDPLISFQGGSYTGGPVNSIAGAALLRMFSQAGQSRTSLSLAGPYLVASGATFTNPDPLSGGPFSIVDGATITSTGTAPFASFTGGSVTTQSTFFNLENNTSFSSPPGSPLTVGSGDAPRVSIAGALITGTDTSFSASNGGVFLRLHNGVSLTETGASPLLDLAGSSPGGVVASAASNFMALSAAHGRPAPILTLGGSLLSAKNATLTNGDPTANTQGFLFVGDSATVTGTGSSSLLSFDASSVDTSGSLLSLRRSTSATAPTMLSLSGPLFTAVNGSTFNTTSLGFGASFGTGGQACCTAFSVSQGAQLSSTTSSPLIQLTNSTFNVGPDTQSGGTFFGLSDSGPPDGIVTPSKVSLAGPLLSASGSTTTALFDLLNVTRSSLTSTSPDALIQLSGSTLSLGGPNPFTPTGNPSGRVLTLVASATLGTVGSNASVSLAGPLLAASGSAVTTATDTVGVFNGASFSSTTVAPLLQLTNTTLTAGTPTVTGNLLSVNNTGGPTGTQGALATLHGPVLSATGSTLNVTGSLLTAGFNSVGQLTVTGSTDPLFSLTGGTHAIASNSGLSAIRLSGRSTALAAETVDGVGLTLGTDEPLRASGPLLETTGATVTAQRGFGIDFALLQATAPILNLKAGSTFTTALDAITLFQKAKLTSQGPLVKLDAGTLNVTSGSLFNVAGGSLLRVTGDLLSLSNGSVITLNGAGNGFLLNASGASVVNISGALVAFGGTGNSIVVSNTVAPNATLSVGGASIPVSLVNGATINQVSIAGTAVKNPTAGTISFPGHGSLIQVNGSTTRVTVSGN